MDTLIELAKFLIPLALGGGLFAAINEWRKTTHAQPLTEADAAKRITDTALSAVSALLAPMSMQLAEQAKIQEGMRYRLRLQEQRMATMNTRFNQIYALAEKYRTGVILLNQQVLELSQGSVSPVFIIERTDNELHQSKTEWEVSSEDSPSGGPNYNWYGGNDARGGNSKGQLPK